MTFLYIVIFIIKIKYNKKTILTSSEMMGFFMVDNFCKSIFFIYICNMETKVCIKCNTEKDVTEFYSGRRPCKNCYNKGKKKEDPDHVKKRRRKYILKIVRRSWSVVENGRGKTLRGLWLIIRDIKKSMLRIGLNLIPYMVYGVLFVI